MDIFRTLDISASGLSGQRARMDAITDNLANSDTVVTASGGPYRRKVVVLQSTDDAGFRDLLHGRGAAGGRPPGGVKVAGVVEMQDAPRRAYLPGHPHADADGFVNFPNVSPLVEMVDMLATTRAYEANATAFQATKTMAAKLLELLR
jgi:flagellar basal-body rod protein FlgC